MSLKRQKKLFGFSEVVFRIEKLVKKCYSIFSVTLCEHLCLYVVGRAVCTGNRRLSNGYCGTGGRYDG